LEAAGLSEPVTVYGVTQRPLEGVSMTYAFGDADAAERHQTQYFEMFCNRGIYHQGWTAVTRHSTPWAFGDQLPALEDDVWELYSPDDWTQAHDIAAEQPEQLRRLQQLFLLEASKYNVFPLDDRRVERFNPDLAGRPQLIRGNRQLLFGGMGRLSENSVVVVKNKSHAVTAQIRVPASGARGVIIAQGGAFGGGACMRMKAGPRTATTSMGFGGSRCMGILRSRPGSTRCGWNSHTTVPGSPRGALSLCTWMGPGSARAGWMRQSR
jgi:hypothetical protein